MTRGGSDAALSAMQVLLNSLRRLLTVVPQTEHTLSRWCGGPDGQRPGSPNAGPPSPNRDGPPPPGALTHDGPGMSATPPLSHRLRTGMVLSSMNCCRFVPTFLFIACCHHVMVSKCLMKTDSFQGAAPQYVQMDVLTTLGLLANTGPHLGAQFAQLVKELRSEYAAAVTACAERIAGALFQRPGYSINATLHRHGISGTPSIMQQQVLPFAICTYPPVFSFCGCLYTGLNSLPLRWARMAAVIRSTARWGQTPKKWAVCSDAMHLAWPSVVSPHQSAATP